MSIPREIEIRVKVFDCERIRLRFFPAISLLQGNGCGKGQNDQKAWQMDIFKQNSRQKKWITSINTYIHICICAAGEAADEDLDT